MKEPDSRVRLIDLEKIETVDIKNVFHDYYIDSSTDSSGDLCIDRSDRIYVKVDSDYNMLRFYSYVSIQADLKDPSVLELLETVNGASSSVKYSPMSQTVMAEYGIPLFGYIDHKHLLKVLDHFDEELKALRIVLDEYVEE